MTKPKTPLAIRILLGVGAIISVSFFLPFFIIQMLDSPSISLLVSGCVLIAFAFGLLAFIYNTEESLGTIYLQQLSIILMIVGKVLFIYGAAKVFGSGSRYASPKMDYAFLAALFITCLTYYFYKSPFERFCSCLMAFFCLITLFVEEKYSPLFFYGFVIALFALWFFSDYVKEISQPIKHASIAALIAVTFTFHTEMNGYQLANKSVLTLIYAFAAAVYAVIIFQKAKPAFEAKLSIAVLLAFLAYFSTSGIILSLIIFMMGVERSDKKYTVFGSLLLAAFLYLYYYSLKISLLDKSLLLSGTGAVLLSGAVFMRMRRFHHAL